MRRVVYLQRSIQLESIQSSPKTPSPWHLEVGREEAFNILLGIYLLKSRWLQALTFCRL